jgi:hypothetical protein
VGLCIGDSHSPQLKIRIPFTYQTSRSIFESYRDRVCDRGEVVQAFRVQLPGWPFRGVAKLGEPQLLLVMNKSTAKKSIVDKSTSVQGNIYGHCALRTVCVCVCKVIRQ